MSRRAFKIAIAAILVTILSIFCWVGYGLWGPEWVYSHNGTIRKDLRSGDEQVLDHGHWREEYVDEFYPPPRPSNRIPPLWSEERVR